MENILIVDQKLETGISLVEELKRENVNLVFTHLALQAIKNVKNSKYDVILIGDKTSEGDVYDVSLAIKSSRKNKGTPVICIGINPGKIARNMKLLAPYAFSVGNGQRDVTILRVNTYLDNIKATKGA